MKHRTLCAAACAVSLASPAYANPHVDRVIEQLKSEGYVSVETERTWLGRIRIEADRDNEEREIVLNRSTGEILRDYSVLIKVGEDEDDDDDGDDDDEDIEDPEFEEGGEEDGPDDDDGDEEDDDDEEEDDEDDEDDDDDDEEE